MNGPAREDVAALLATSESPRLSIALAAEPTTPQGSLFYRNLLRDAERQAAARGIAAGQIAPLLEHAEALAEDRSFWEQPGQGAVLYAEPGAQRAYRLPYPVAGRAVVGPDFLITPLAPLLAADQPCYVLALSLGAVRLVRCGRAGASEVPLPASVPPSLEVALGRDEYERERRFTPGQTGTAGRQDTVYYSHGVGSDERTGQLRRYCQQIDRGLREVLTPPGTPLILAGVGEVVATYRQISDYPAILTEEIGGNPDRLSVAALHERARPLIADLERRRDAGLVARYRAAAGTGLTSADPAEIASAASAGRVATLFVAQSTAAPGNYNAITPAEALVNRATIDTLANGGTVVQVEMGSLPDGAGLAGLFRY